ncbi:MAG TPA: MFS transporter [Solirubrobacterales bacterium]|jgi:MFS family permease|nr:MFS transporter [Solirubrobacterales bacterium]
MPIVQRLERLSRPVTFWAIAAIIALYLAAAAAPTPLYVVYQEEWGFSATTLTLVFSVYVFGLLGSLLVLGGLSDHIGRRPLAAAAVALEVVAMVLFLLAGSVEVLAAARVVQGIATGIALSTLGAALVDLDPPDEPGLAGIVSGLAPLIGLAVGALVCGALVEYGPMPTELVYILVLVGLAAAAVVVARMPESSPCVPGARASLVPRIEIPARVRPEILAMTPILVATWALCGLYLALGPSVAAQIFKLPNHVIGGLVVALLCGTGAITIYAMRGWGLARSLELAAVVLAVGMALTLAGLLVEQAALAAFGAIVAGVGFGAAGRGTFGTIAAIAAPEERGGLFAAFYVISYVAFSIPAIAAGFADTSLGLRPTAIAYGAVVLVLSLGAIWAQRRLEAQRAMVAY